MVTVPNGVDLRQIDAVAAPPAGRVLFAGRFNRTKGADVLLKAWKIVESQDPHCTGAGWNWTRGEQAAPAGPGLSCVPALARQLEPLETLRALSSASIVCLPRAGRACPWSPWRYGAGRALVTTDVDAFPKSCCKIRRVDVAKEDSEALAKALLALLMEPSRSADSAPPVAAGSKTTSPGADHPTLSQGLPGHRKAKLR